MGIGIRDRIVEKMIDVLTNDATVIKYCSTRVYGSHISTVTDPIYPSCTIHILPGSGVQSQAGFLNVVNFQIEPWMMAVGQNANTPDDIWELYTAIVNSLHRIKGWDDTIGIKILDIKETQKGRRLTDPHGVMHIPGRWQVVATA